MPDEKGDAWPTQHGTYLSSRALEVARSWLPIACVDALVYRNGGRSGLQIGLIYRSVKETGTRGWAMFGGRVYRGETLSRAVKRHVVEALDLPDRSSFDWDDLIDRCMRPLVIGQYFPEGPNGFPADPRQHSIALTYALRWRDGDSSMMGQGSQREAKDFRWFDVVSSDSKMDGSSTIQFVDSITNKLLKDDDVIFGQIQIIRKAAKALEAEEPTREKAEGDLLVAMYRALMDRRNATDTLRWQVPALSFFGQGFLLTIALGPEGSTYSRGVAAGLSVFFSWISIQLMARHTHFERLDSRHGERVEEELRKRTGSMSLAGIPPVFSEPKTRETPLGFHPRWLGGMRSTGWWLAGFAILGSIGVSTIVVVSFFHELLG